MVLVAAAVPAVSVDCVAPSKMATLGLSKVFILDKYFTELQKFWETEKKLQDASSSNEAVHLQQRLKSLSSELVTLRNRLHTGGQPTAGGGGGAPNGGAVPVGAGGVVSPAAATPNSNNCTGQNGAAQHNTAGTAVGLGSHGGTTALTTAGLLASNVNASNGLNGVLPNHLANGCPNNNNSNNNKNNAAANNAKVRSVKRWDPVMTMMMILMFPFADDCCSFRAEPYADGGGPMSTTECTRSGQPAAHRSTQRHHQWQWHPARRFTA
ncbi:putative uncharacterized protein DDB_G0286901 [Anopheles darlingi]|uniref:putative uncharacterized protein DDB_G0286901 n=1 Tax=Anopheles darlingi TaxID=43151 RepID=UPI0020FFF9FD|nr:putative uncharacterized protein DDB_G0286901 [Anopheles darlingi]